MVSRIQGIDVHCTVVSRIQGVYVQCTQNSGLQYTMYLCKVYTILNLQYTMYLCTVYTIQWSPKHKVCTVNAIQIMYILHDTVVYRIPGINVLYTIQWFWEYKVFMYRVYNTMVSRIQCFYVQSIQYNGLQNTRFLCTEYTIQWSWEYKVFMYRVYNTMVSRIQGFYVPGTEFNEFAGLINYPRFKFELPIKILTESITINS